MIQNLELLEQKILLLIQHNKELKYFVDELTTEKVKLEDQIKQLETTLLKEVSVAQAFSNEKNEIKHTIEGILTAINSIEGI